MNSLGSPCQATFARHSQLVMSTSCRATARTLSHQCRAQQMMNANLQTIANKTCNLLADKVDSLCGSKQVRFSQPCCTLCCPSCSLLFAERCRVRDATVLSESSSQISTAVPCSYVCLALCRCDCAPWMWQGQIDLNCPPRGAAATCLLAMTSTPLVIMSSR